MDDMDFPTPDVPIDSITPTELKRRIDEGEEFTMLDTRMNADYEEWHIEGDSFDSVNIPYFEFLDDEIDAGFLDQLPQHEPITVVCAKGGSSAYVAGRLTDLDFTVDHLEDGMNGWAQLFEAVEVSAYDGSGTVIQYQRPSSGCLGYLIADGKQAAVVDPLRVLSDRYLRDAADLGVDLSYALDTHIHADHVSGVRELTDEGVVGVLPTASADRGVTYAADVTLVDDGDTVSVGDVTIEAVSTPGHTSDMTSYLVDDSMLLTGDGLFTDSVARPDLEEGDEGAPEAAQLLYDTLQQRILTLPDETLIGGGHFSGISRPAVDQTYTATIGQLGESMPALSLDKSAFVDLILADMPPRPANYETIIATNLGKYHADDEEAFELELGPNNCAASQETLAAD